MAAVQTAVVNCPKAKVGRIIGKGGETIKALQNYTGAMIQIDQSSDPTRVTVAGSLHSLSLAVSMIQDIVEGHFKGFAMLRQVSGAKEPTSDLPSPVDAAGQPQPVYVEGYGFVPPSQLCNTESLLAHPLGSNNSIQDRSASQPSSRDEPGLLWQALNDCPKGFSPELLLQQLAALQRTRSPSPPTNSSLWNGGNYLAATSAAPVGRAESFGRNESFSRTSAESTYDTTSAPAAAALYGSAPMDLAAMSAAQASSTLYQSSMPPKAPVLAMSGGGLMAAAANGLMDGLPAGWMHVRDPEGRFFYYNTMSGAAQWDPPSLGAISNSSLASLTTRQY